VPPFTHLEKLLKLKKEKEDLDEKEAIRQKKIAEGQTVPDDDQEGKDGYGEDQPDPKRFDAIALFDFPEDLKGESIVCYDNAKLTLYDIFKDYGTEVKPKEDPKYDPKPPDPKEKVEKPTPPPVVKKEEAEDKNEEEKEGEDDAEGSPGKVMEEPEPEEIFIPPVEKVLWYDFDAYDGKDPVLLALMHRGENDTFTI